MKKAGIKSSFKAMLLFLIFVFQILSLSGQVAVSDSLSAVRLKDIQILLHRDRINAQRWWYGWLAGYSAATVGQGFVYLSVGDKATKQNMVLGSATTFLGVIGQILTPLVPRTSSFQKSQIHGGEYGERFKNPDNSEEMLKEIALRETKGRSWKIHAVTGVVNVGSGLITWLGFRRTVWEGVENFALNTVITETQIWTQPTRALKDYQNYCRKYNSGSGMKVLKPENEWVVRAYPGGIAIEFNF